MTIKVFGFFVYMFMAAMCANAQIAAGGIYGLDQAVVANGGGTSADAGSNYKIEGTSGQSAAGTFGTGGVYTVRGGFWAVNLLAPTAAGANISGRVLGLGSEGLRNVSVVLAGGNLFGPRTVRTNTFGNFTFEDVPVGGVYTLTVNNRKYGFAQNTQVISLLDNVSDVVFQASWEN